METNRRQFIQASTAVLAIGIADTTMLFSGISTAKAADLGKVRRDINANVPGSNDLILYSTAVQRMKALDQSDPKNPMSWNNQALIHQNYCPHSNWWFLPWHRAYLFYFESICQSMLGDPDFRLPYWNWTRDRSIPAAFWDKKSPLFHSNRDLNPNDEVDGDVTGSSVIDKILKNNVDALHFSGATTSDNQRESSFAGTLESTPHNGIHQFIGGDMGTYLSPQDPIFWLHHANVDRLWRSWSALHENRALTDKLWKDHKLSQFYDATGKVMNPLTQSTLVPEAYNAIYDQLDVVASNRARQPMRAFAFNKEATVALSARISTVGNTLKVGTIDLASDSKLRNSISKATAPLLALEEKPVDSVVLMKVEGIQVKSKTTRLRIFINCDNPSPNTPIGSPSYVATINFFGGDHSHHDDRGFSFMYDCTATFANLKRTGLYNGADSIKVSFVPIDTKKGVEPAPFIDVKPEQITFIGL
ncbi:tyrosinase family protein [Pseudomonas sp. lyk4-TYG-107]|uniref:tyrosinase family protein n=1 Tax=Pseudomonas sp. lyk4-TYG-107 TaxID=3040317 RepID=UPI0025569815|nr:tyrosinase family protein [Pseudomonas sp. lyk4-TYG-107]